MRVLIADGGTGGHIFPALAVAEELQKRKGFESVLFTGTELGLEGELIPKHGYNVAFIRVGGLIGKSLARRIRTIMQLPLAFLESRTIIRKFRPDVVIGFGAYAAGPVLVAAHFRKIPVLLVEPNAVPGFTNRMALRFAKRIAVPFPDSNGIYTGKAVVTGVPVRPLKETSISRKKFTVGILGGSQGARAINETIVSALPQLAELRDRLHLIHQTGKNDFDAIRKEYEQVAPHFEVAPFIDNMEQFYNRCDLLICRAGAVTLAEITALGKPAVLIPLPTSTHGHQEENARRLHQAGAARMILQKDFTATILVDLLHEFLKFPAKLSKMAEASKALGKPEATQKVVDLALSLMQGNSGEISEASR